MIAWVTVARVWIRRNRTSLLGYVVPLIKPSSYCRRVFFCLIELISFMNKQVRSVLLLLFFVSPLVILVILAVHRSHDPHYGDRKTILKWGEEDIALWAQKKYVPFTNRRAIKTILENFQISGSALTPEMREAYWEALENFLFAFTDGGIENWKKYRFDGLSENLTTYGKYQVKYYYGLVDRGGTAYPDHLPRDINFREKWSQGIQTDVPPVISNDKDLEDLFYKLVGEITYGKTNKDYFNGFCLDEMIVKHDHYTSHPAPLYEYPFFPFRVQRGLAIDATFPNEGYEPWSNEYPGTSYFIVHPTLTELLSEEGGVDCINTFVYIKINEAGKVAPFLLRHVWNPKTKRWQIAEVVDAHLSSYNRVIRAILL